MELDISQSTLNVEVEIVKETPLIVDLTVPQGADGLVFQNDKPTLAIFALNDGSSPVLTDASISVSIIRGINNDTANWTITATPTGCAGTLVDHTTYYTYTVSGMTSDTATVAFSAARSGFATLSSVSTLTKVKQPNIVSSIEAGTATATPADTDVLPGVKADHSLLKYTWANIKAAIATYLDRASTTVRGIVQLAADGGTTAGTVVQGNDARLADVGVFASSATLDETEAHAPRSEILRFIKSIIIWDQSDLIGIGVENQYHLRSVCRNYNGLWQIYIANSLENIVCRFTSSDFGLYAEQFGLETVKLRPYGDTGIFAEMVIDWSALADGCNYGSMTYTTHGFKDSVVFGYGVKYPNSQWRGKKILWLGTSIPAGGRYPEIAAAMHGAHLTNMALGSSCARMSKADGTYTGQTWESYVYALSQTAAEKQSIIDNWDTIKTSLINSPPDTLSAEVQAGILASSYETRLAPYRNYDLIVFNHDYNDNFESDTDADFTTVPAIRNDRRYFLGALNYLIDTIFSSNNGTGKNPFTRIAFIGPYDNGIRPLSTFRVRQVTALETIAEFWGAPLCRVWEKSGFSQQIIPGTSTTMLEHYLPDGIHPHTDASGEAQLILGNIVGDFLAGIR